MDLGELEGAQRILYMMGEEKFLENWKFYKEQLDEIRHTFESRPYRLKGWLKEYHL